MESRDGPHPARAGLAQWHAYGARFPQTSLARARGWRLNHPRRIGADENLNLVLAKLTKLRCQRPREAVCSVDIGALATVSPVNQSRIAASTRLALAPISR